MAEQQTQQENTPRKKTALEHDKLSLFARPGAPGQRAPKLTWSMINGNPRVMVYTNDPEDQGNDYGRITAKLDTPVFFALLELLERAAKSPEETKTKLENKNHTYYEGKRSETASVVSELMFGKDQAGIVWLSVVMPNRPKIKFKFTFGDYHEFYHGDGTPFTESEASALSAVAYTNLLRKWAANVANSDDQIPEPQPRKDGGKGRGNWNGGKGGNGGGGNYRRDNNGGGYRGGNSGGRGDWKQNNRGGGDGYNKPNNQSRPAGGSTDDFADDDIPF